MNYAVDPAIKGSISLRIKGKYSKESLLDLLNTILELNGLAVTRAGEDLYKVVRKGNSARSGSQIKAKGAKRLRLRPGDIIQVFQLQYLSAAQAAGALRNFVSASAVMVPEASTNSILIADTMTSLDKVSRILAIIDAPPFDHVHWEIFPLKATEAKKLSSDLQKIFKAPGLYARPGQDTGGFFILPLETINAVLVATRWAGLLDIARNWIRELDRGEAEFGSQVYVYFVQNGRAKDIVDILNQLYGGSAKTDKGGQKKVLVKRGKSRGTASGELAGNVEIIADDVNNAIIIKAASKDYQTITKVLKAIDVVPRQVLIEVLIAEVSLSKDTQYGVEWFIKNRGIKIGGKGYQGDISLSEGKTLSVDTGLGEGLTGLTYGLFNGAGDLRGLLNTIASFSDVNILSSPTILSVDNQESSIEVGDDVPTLTGTTTTTGGTVTQSVQYRNAGIILKVKPYINDRGLVRLEITQEVSTVSDESTAGITSPRFRTRKASTNLIAEDGQTIVIGGLMQTQKTRTRSGIPLLKDIPVLGYVFGSHGFTTEKTELLIAITPHVIQSRAEADAITREFENKVKDLKKMLGSGQKGQKKS